jgi:hypothetical protein
MPLRPKVVRVRSRYGIKRIMRGTMPLSLWTIGYIVLQRGTVCYNA